MSQFLSINSALYTAFGSQHVEDGNSWDRGRNWFDYRKRGRLTAFDRHSWLSLWSSSGFMGSGENGEDLTQFDRNAGYSRWSITARGGRKYKVVTGNVIDTNGTPVTGANLSLFLTSNASFVSAGTSDSNGNYEIGTEFYGNTHFIVAYVDAGTDKTGTSINNLTPLNRDGT